MPACPASINNSCGKDKCEGWSAAVLSSQEWIKLQIKLGLEQEVKKQREGGSEEDRGKQKEHQPLIPGRSMLACSWIPMPLRMILREPSLNAPEQVTSWKQTRRDTNQGEKKFFYFGKRTTVFWNGFCVIAVVITFSFNCASRSYLGEVKA